MSEWSQCDIKIYKYMTVQNTILNSNLEYNFLYDLLSTGITGMFRKFLCCWHRLLYYTMIILRPLTTIAFILFIIRNIALLPRHLVYLGCKKQSIIY